jgi:septal ring factor EnvC (AmiA/AmiB activator)
MAGGRYSQGQINKQMANAVKKQESVPTRGNGGRKEVEYNQVDSPSVPSEPQAFEKFLNFCSQYASWIAWTITLATAMGAFLNFQSDLKRAESDIKNNQQLIDKNSAKNVVLDKILVEQKKDISYIKTEVSDVEISLDKVSNKINSLSERQLALEYGVKSAANKQINQD